MLTFLILVALVGIAYALVTRYNALQLLAHGVHEARANVLASVKKRDDLVNRLVSLVQSYTDHEKVTHFKLGSIDSDIAAITAGQSVSSVVSHVAQLASRYPDLKANESYNQLMHQQAAIEQDLQNKREHYNAQVRQYNATLTQLPTSLFAASLGFRTAEYFTMENADSLESLSSFTDDGTIVREMLTQGGKRVASESARLGRVLVDKGRELQAGRSSMERPTPMLDDGSSGTAPLRPDTGHRAHVIPTRPAAVLTASPRARCVFDRQTRAR